MRKAIIAATLAALGITTIASAQNRLPRECRQEIVKLCGTDRSQIRGCLREKLSELSETCQTELRSRFQARRNSRGAETSMPATPRPASTTISYGDHQRQAIDYYAPVLGQTIAGKPALILFIHGGGWSFGSKERTVQQKPRHFTQRGYAFASTGYRLMPDHPVEQQAEDIGAAIKAIRAQADALGFDADRIVLMGHSAGAHLAALVSTDPQYAGDAFGAIKGVVLLDGAGYDIAKNMSMATGPAAGLYSRVFGDDEARKTALSPVTHAGGPDAPNWLILHVANRKRSQVQSETLGKALSDAGAKATVTAIPNTDHGRMNREIGTSENDATTLAIDAFLKGVVG